MVFSIPRHILAASVDTPNIVYRWDDWRASEDFTYDASEIVEKLFGATLRARIAIGIGIYEWIVWRFRSILRDATPFQLAEAAWCANVRRDYMEYDEFDRGDWIGPVRGPLWCAMTWLMPMIFSGDDDPAEWQSGLSYLPRLAVHVLPDPAVFQDWLDQCIDRLIMLYAAPPEDPFDDLFGERQEERRGPLVPREALDPCFDFQPEMTGHLIDQYLRSVDYSSNQFLKRTDLLVAQGFPGTPYRFNEI